MNMLNTESKTVCSGHYTMEDGNHPQAFKGIPFSCRNDQTCGKISSANERKGFHHLPSHEPDVQLVLRHLLERNAIKSKRKSNVKTQLQNKTVISYKSYILN